jgi:glycine/D-amino acid oxidase-like deaminating enzyme
VAERFDAVVVGAGMAGVSAAFSLAEAGVGRVAIIEEGAPLALTSDKSSECYRNYWPGPDSTMFDFMQDSLRGLEHHARVSGDRFQLRQRGYLFATAREAEFARMLAEVEQVSSFGGGAVRMNPTDYRRSPEAGTDPELDGADVFSDRGAIAEHFPYLTPDTVGVVHVRWCGMLSAQQLGMYLLETARERGAVLVNARFEGIETEGGRLARVICRRDGALVEIETDALVLSPGPHLKSVAKAVGADVPVGVEKHCKISFSDSRGVILRDAPLIIWNDPVDLTWSAEEREMLAESDETRWLTETMPAGFHGRPVGAGDQVVLLWSHNTELLDEPVFPVEPDAFDAEIMLRGMAEVLPGLKAYLDPMPQPYVDGGYYTKTPDNRPLIGPLGVPGTYVCAAFSGYGIMASPAAGALIAAHIVGGQLPGYARGLRPERFNDQAYLASLAGLSRIGQI